MIEQNGCDECVPMIRILLFSSGFVIGQWIYLWWLAQNAKILRRDPCFASRGCATFSILLCKILPRLVCGTPLLPPMCRRKIENEHLIRRLRRHLPQGEGYFVCGTLLRQMYRRKIDNEHLIRRLRRHFPQ